MKPQHSNSIATLFDELLHPPKIGLAEGVVDTNNLDENRGEAMDTTHDVESNSQQSAPEFAQQRMIEVVKFLQHLDPSPVATFNIEHYTDAPKGSNKQKPDLLLGRHPNLTLTEVQELLPRLNELNEEGAGIFVARNQCLSQQSAAEITRIRVWGLYGPR